MEQTLSLKPYTVLDKMIFFMYMMHFILKPFYFWSSGLPQISDFVVAVLIVLYTFKNNLKYKIPSQAKIFLGFGAIFVLYIFLINSIWMVIISSSFNLFKTSSYYLYNFILILVTVTLYEEYGEKIIRITYNAIIFSLFIQVIMFIINGGFSGGRMTGSFNNPNQLGYYALLSFSFIIFCSGKIIIDSKWFVFGLSITALFVFVSLSKATIISYVCLLIVFFLSNSTNKKLKKIFIIIFIVFTPLITYIYQATDIIHDNQLYRAINARMSSIGQTHDDNLTGRGYHRITEYPEYWIFGAGEGEYGRFNSRGEFHSTLGNIQVSYGIIGSLLFASMLLIALRNDRFKSWHIIAAIIAYGLTHNGIRHSWFWVLLAFITCNNENKKV